MNQNKILIAFIGLILFITSMSIASKWVDHRIFVEQQEMLLKASEFIEWACEDGVGVYKNGNLTCERQDEIITL